MFFKLNGIGKVNVKYNNLQCKPKNKTFPGEDYKSVLDFAVSITRDMYISSCPVEILAWAQQNAHPILVHKRWDFY